MSTINYQVFRRQYYIGPNKKIVDDTWKSISICCGLTLSYNQELPVKEIKDMDGKVWVLIGDAIQSLKGLPSPEEILAHFNSSQDLHEIYKSWANRWILIGNNELHLDAAGLLGCYYKKIDHQIEIASIAGLITGKDKPETFRLLKAGGAEFYPPPDTGFNNVFKLLPSQILQIDTGEIKFRSLHCAIPDLTYDAKIAYLAELLSTTLSNAYKKFNKKFLLALTGGYDSRTLMAALNYTHTPYESLTFHRPLMFPPDAQIPKKLASIAGVKHRLIRRQNRKSENDKKFDVHTTCHSVEVDRQFMLYQQFDCLDGNNSVLIRGGGFEVGRCAYYPWLPAELIDGHGISRIQKGNSIQGESWNKWIDWIKKTPQIKMDWRDRYYIEQRLSGWLSSTEQALDLVNIDRLIPANSSLFYNIMLSIPEEIRKTKVQMKDMIHFMSPDLLSAPINPKIGFLFKQYRRVFMKINKFKQKLYNKL